jgi:DNA helicase HerA-like ATPase
MVELEQQGAESFLGEPELDIDYLMQTERDGRGLVCILELSDVQDKPALFTKFMLWMLATLYNQLPEVGDIDKPKLVFFFDEAHLLFDGASKALLDEVEKVVRLIRSKGVGIFFITQSPKDIPADVLGQLGNRVQHALRAFTPRDQRAVRAAAETFRANPKFDASEAITQLGVGEALVSTLQDKGVPSVVERTLVRPPCSRIGPATAAERQAAMEQSPIAGHYDQPIDRESAYEVLQRRAEQQAPEASEAHSEHARRVGSGAGTRVPSGGSRRQGAIEAMITSAARSLGTQIGRQLLRGVLGSLSRR